MIPASSIYVRSIPIHQEVGFSCSCASGVRSRGRVGKGREGTSRHTHPTLNVDVPRRMSSFLLADRDSHSRITHRPDSPLLSPCLTITTHQSATDSDHLNSLHLHTYDWGLHLVVPDLLTPSIPARPCLSTTYLPTILISYVRSTPYFHVPWWSVYPLTRASSPLGPVQKAVVVSTRRGNSAWHDEACIGRYCARWLCLYATG